MLRAKRKGIPAFLADEAEDDVVPMETDHVIQKLYDAVNIKKLFEDCLLAEKRYSIDMDYRLSETILGSKEDFAKTLIENGT